MQLHQDFLCFESLICSHWSDPRNYVLPLLFLLCPSPVQSLLVVIHHHQNHDHHVKCTKIIRRSWSIASQLPSLLRNPFRFLAWPVHPTSSNSIPNQAIRSQPPTPNPQYLPKLICRRSGKWSLASTGRTIAQGFNVPENRPKIHRLAGPHPCKVIRWLSETTTMDHLAESSRL